MGSQQKEPSHMQSILRIPLGILVSLVVILRSIRFQRSYSLVELVITGLECLVEFFFAVKCYHIVFRREEGTRREKRNIKEDKETKKCDDKDGQVEKNRTEKLIKDLTGQNDQFRQIISHLREENKILSDKQESHLEESRIMSSKLAFCKNKLNMLKVKSFNSVSDNKKLQLKMENVVEQNKQLKKDIATTRETNTHYLKNMNTLYDKVHVLQKQLQLKDNSAACKNYFKIKEEELEHKNQIIQNLTASNESLSRELEDKMNDFIQLIGQMTELQSSNDSNKEEVSKLEFKIKRLTDDNQRIRTERADNDEQIKSLNDNLYLMEEKLQEVSKTNENLNEQLSQVKIDKQILHVSNQSLRLENNLFQNKLMLLENAKKDLVKSEFKIKELTRVNVELQDKLAKVRQTPTDTINDNTSKLNIELNRVSQMNQTYLLKLSEIKLSLKVKEKQINMFKEEIKQHKDYFTKSEEFINHFEQKLYMMCQLLKELIPKYLQQKQFSQKLVHLVSVEDKNFVLLHEVREKNYRFKRILKTIMDENINVRNELELKKEQLRSLKGQLELYEELVAVLNYKENSIDSKVSPSGNGDFKATDCFTNDFQLKDIFINDRLISTASDLSLISYEASSPLGTPDLASLLESPVPSEIEYNSPLRIDLRSVAIADEEFSDDLSQLFKQTKYGTNSFTLDTFEDDTFLQNSLNNLVGCYDSNVDIASICTALQSFETQLAGEVKSIQSWLQQNVPKETEPENSHSTSNSLGIKKKKVSVFQDETFFVSPNGSKGNSTLKKPNGALLRAENVFYTTSPSKSNKTRLYNKPFGLSLKPKNELNILK